MLAYLGADPCDYATGFVGETLGFSAHWLGDQARADDFRAVSRKLADPNDDLPSNFFRRRADHIERLRSVQPRLTHSVDLDDGFRPRARGRESILGLHDLGRWQIGDGADGRCCTRIAPNPREYFSQICSRGMPPKSIRSSWFMELDFVAATEADLGFFIHTHHTAYRATVEKMFGWNEALQNKIATEKFQLGHIKILHFEGRRVGVVGWEEKEDHLWLKELFVLPTEQGRGIGTVVIQYIKSIATARNVQIRLRTLKENLRAKTLYEQNGFAVSITTDVHWNMVSA